MKSSNITIFLLVPTMGCQPPLEATTFKGTWTTTQIQFVDNQCGLEDILTTTIEQQTYIFGEVPSAQDDNSYYIDELTEPIITDLGENIWSHCEFDNSPDFNCPLPLQAVHFPLWASALVSTEESTGLCEEEPPISEVSGYTSGIFIDENNAFFTTDLRVYCSQNSEVECNTRLEFRLAK